MLCHYGCTSQELDLALSTPIDLWAFQLLNCCEFLISEHAGEPDRRIEQHHAAENKLQQATRVPSSGKTEGGGGQEYFPRINSSWVTIK